MYGSRSLYANNADDSNMLGQFWGSFYFVGHTENKWFATVYSLNIDASVQISISAWIKLPSFF